MRHFHGSQRTRVTFRLKFGMRITHSSYYQCSIFILENHKTPTNRLLKANLCFEKKLDFTRENRKLELELELENVESPPLFENAKS